MVEDVRRLRVGEKRRMNYNGRYAVYLSRRKKVVMIELKAKDKLRSRAVITRDLDVKEIKKFLEWLEEREEIVIELDELNRGTLWKKRKRTDLSEKFRKIVRELGVNERKEIPTYQEKYSISKMYMVAIARIMNPRSKSGETQLRIELRSPDKPKPVAFITDYSDYLELKNFIKWLENFKELINEITKINETDKVYF